MYKVIRKARKEYSCLFCGDPINKGQQYAYIQITPWCHPDNESFDVWRAHQICEKNSWEFYKEDIEIDGGIMMDVGSPCRRNQREFRDFIKDKSNE